MKIKYFMQIDFSLEIFSRNKILSIFKTSEWNEYVISWLSYLTYVDPLFSQAKWYVLILFKNLIPLTWLNDSNLDNLDFIGWR